MPGNNAPHNGIINGIVTMCQTIPERDNGSCVRNRIEYTSN